MKKKLFMFTLLLFALNGKAQVITDSLLVYYPFNGNSNDLSGNGFNATGNAVLTLDRIGNSNAAMSFNGTNTYLDLPNDTMLKPQFPVSFSFWVKANDISIPSVMFTTDFAQDNYHGCWVAYTAGTGEIVVNFGDGSGTTGGSSRRSYTGTTQIQNNTWYHVACIIRGPLDMDIYLNCNLETGTYSGSGGGLTYSSAAGSLGRADTQTSGPAWYFPGSLDDFRYWNRELNSTDIEFLCTEAPTSISSRSAGNSPSLYLDPSGNILTVFPGDRRMESFQLFNSLGQLININNEKEHMDVSSLPSGLYFVRISNPGFDAEPVLKFFKL